MTDGNVGGSGNIGVPGDPVSLQYNGCSSVWIILLGSNQPPIDAAITVYNEQTSATETVPVTITASDLETVPGQHGDNPLYKFDVHDFFNRPESSDDKVVSVVIGSGTSVGNPNNCANNI